ncbi:MAG: hypothetical protein IJH25_09715, partial [Clostridia bacterium]|nr:hypothetical protein [Clostridia bacterium]
ICTVFDDYGNERRVVFEIYTEDGHPNDLEAHAVGASDITIPVGDSGTLAVEATCSDAEAAPYTYAWYRREKVFDSDNSYYNYGAWTRIEGWDQPSQTLEGSDAFTTQYRCTVTDAFWHSVDVDFQVYVDAGFDVQIDEERTRRFVPYGEPATLALNATGEDVAIYWYSNEPERDYQLVGTGDTYVTPAVTERVSYRYCVMDRYWNWYENSYDVSVDNQLTVQARGGVTQLVVPAGEDVTLEVVTSASDMQGVTWQWSEQVSYDEMPWEWDWKDMSGKTAATLELNGVNESTEYRCEVRDRFGNTAAVTFTIQTVESEDPSALPVGETGATASIDEGGKSALFELEVSEPGRYRLTASSDIGYSIVLGLLDSEWNMLALDDRGNWEARLVRELAAGTYYLAAWFYDDNATGNITVRAELPAELQGLTALTLNEDVTVSFTNYTSRYFTFTPQTDGLYAVCLSGDGSFWGESRDGNLGYQSTYEIASEEGTHCYVSPLTGNRTYYIYTSFGNDEGGSFTVRVEPYQGLASANGYGGYSVSLHASVTLEPNVVCSEGTSLSYVWKNEAGEVLATTKLYTVKNVQKRTRLTCEVSDGNPAHDCVADFDLQVENDLQIESVGENYFYPASGESVTMQVAASCRDGKDALKYEWYVDNDESNDIGDGSDTLTIVADSQHTDYECKVTDIYGNRLWECFYVYAND